MENKASLDIKTWGVCTTVKCLVEGIRRELCKIMSVDLPTPQHFFFPSVLFFLMIASEMQFSYHVQH